MQRARPIVLLLTMLLLLNGCRSGESTLAPPPTAAPTVAPTAATTIPAMTATTTAAVTTPATMAATTTAPVTTSATPASNTTRCAFTPPFAGVATPVARPVPTATTVPSGQPTRRPAAPLPEQVPPTLPLPNLAARYRLAVDRYVSRADRSDFHAAETVAVTNREGCALDRLTFSITAARWGWFTLNGVQVGGQTVVAQVVGTMLAVPLPQVLAPGATVEVVFDFALSVGAPVDPYTPGGYAGTLRTGDILRLAYWFPILSDDHQYPPFLDPPYTATADFDVSLTLPSNLVVAHTGVATEQRRNADGTVTYRIEAPNVRDFVVGLSPSYQVARRTAANGVVVELYYDPKSLDPNGQQAGVVQQRVNATLAASVLAVERLSALIGPYPYPVLRVVDSGPSMLGGIEFPMLVTVNLSLPSLNNLVYHEIAHEWLYGILGTRTQQDPWIDEGGATFLADYLDNTLADNPPGAADFTYRLNSSVWDVPPVGFQRNATASIYTQGGAFYTRVMHTMGEDAFWRAFQSVYRDYRFGIVTPRALLTAWQRASPTDLRPLFREYFDYPWIDELTR